jgi:hypothetical protein
MGLPTGGKKLDRRLSLGVDGRFWMLSIVRSLNDGRDDLLFSGTAGTPSMLVYPGDSIGESSREPGLDADAVCDGSLLERDRGLPIDPRELRESFFECLMPFTLFLGTDDFDVELVSFPVRVSAGMDLRFCSLGSTGGALVGLPDSTASSCFGTKTWDVLLRKTGSLDGRGRPDGLFILVADNSGSISVPIRMFRGRVALCTFHDTSPTFRAAGKSKPGLFCPWTMLLNSSPEARLRLGCWPFGVARALGPCGQLAYRPPQTRPH